jgi:hypothetical protein
MTAAWPHISVAQQSTVPTVGYLGSLAPELFGLTASF